MGRALPGDHRLVEAEAAADALTVPENLIVQHHAIFHGIPAFQHIGKALDVLLFQLRDEAHMAQVDAQHGHSVLRGQLGIVEHGSVAAKAEEQIRAADIGAGVGTQGVVGHVHGQGFRRSQREKGLCLRATLPQIIQDLHGKGQVPVLVIIRTNQYSLHFSALYASSTILRGSSRASAGCLRR